eukprot:CAMPEP_0114339472 /NCGR_PEP_ID=MMETSP0101-20121206/7756_1 /TAXON_ID=38822 ORGANISM="Pteridomonas danica, Strain PT" /NCGR_SAMPLE_ID=MMETSP0101 /ASSEMBLY_ACC=CAM_ASM_000211 /LENGTH=378 /DNA_ID=CAMNT_0001472459 /DNA_START=170 /DNA_END=1306 /DNA_ORIENTATION=-
MAENDKVALVDDDDETENPNEFIPLDEHLQGDDDGAPEWLVKIPLLPCWDETDDGVPPFCRGDAPVAWWKVFNPSNRYTNDNLIMIAFGNVGFKYFDKNRKYWMGAAMWSTLISIAFTIAGCFALSTNMNIVKNTHWVYVVAKDMSTDEYFTAHLGLRSLVYTSEPCTVLHCERKSYAYSIADHNWPNTFMDGGLAGCRTIAYGTAFGAFTTCATLLFALMGTMNRMRFSSDANIQKALGMITDLCGFISLTATLFNFGSACWGDINRNYTGFSNISVYMGPGYACYCVCLFGAFMRALFHWVTPLPGRGSGCVPSLPKSLVKKLDRDGDGKVSWEEMKLGYRDMVAARRLKAQEKAAKRKNKAQVEQPLSANGDDKL